MLKKNSEMGLMHITGTHDGPPVKVGCAVTDLTTGLYTANSIMAALLGRAKTGEGQHLDVCLSDCQVATLSNMAESVLIGGKEYDSGRWGTSHRKSVSSHPFGWTNVCLASVVPYRGFKTADGDIMIGGGNDRLFGILCVGLGKPEWATDERFATNAHRVDNRTTLEPMLEKELMSKTTQEWMDIFEGKGLPYAKVNDLHGTVTHDHGTYRRTCLWKHC
jgi:succinate--hydroxymethylglutarate CoA-transferase